MEDSKIRLSAEEWQLVQNSAWILTKHAVIDKVYHLFGGLSQRMQLSLQAPRGLPGAVVQHSPKISKGEQYEHMPWVVLDYPRCFGREDVFAIRTFFWWGHYFSCTLHLKGIYRQEFASRIVMAARDGKLDGYYWCAGGAEFNFDVLAEGYARVGSRALTVEDVLSAPFIKLAFTHPLEKWDAAQEQLLKAFETFVAIAGR